MSKIIRIGTRDSALALWQANTVKQQLEELGYETTLVPVKSTGDIVLDKPLYELGITGIFTRTLDIAMLNNDIDIAVHSLKDVPTVLPSGIIQAAVLKRGNFNDLLVYKNNEEFLAQQEAIIATGSLRRRAQWLNRYPTHTVVGLRGNVNTRLKKLQDNDWNAAIFAAAGLKRIGIKPTNTITLDWMIPAPAQGAIMITALDEDAYVKEACAQLNHRETEICTGIERTFLNRLEGGCTAPIGALAVIRDDHVIFKGILLSKDGTKKIEISKKVPVETHETLGISCADEIIQKGGKRLMDGMSREVKKATVISTKKLTKTQDALFHKKIVVNSNDFIQVSTNRIGAHVFSKPIKNVIITSKNGVESIVLNCSKDEFDFENIYCVGRRTKRLIEQKIGPVKYSAKNAKALAEYLVNNIDGTEATYFCSDIRMDDLPNILNEHNITLHEVNAYSTKFNAIKAGDNIKGAMFYSPSTVKSYLQRNDANGIAFCIGESTANEAKKHFNEVRIAKVPTVESVIELVNDNFI